jgi:hypothetical protein
MKKIFLIIISISLFFCSCSNKIDGRIVDNFGKPVEGAEVSIKGSINKVLSNSNGAFVINYAADEFTLQFKKIGYIPHFQQVKMSELKKHSLGNLRVIKSPDSMGVYLQDKDDYKKLPEVILDIIRNEFINNGKVTASQITLNFTPKMVFSIEKDSVDSECIFVFGKEHYVLVEPDSNGNVASIISGKSSFQEIKETVNHPEENIEEHRFSPQFDKIYALISIDESSNSKNIIDNRAFVFKYVKKN